MKTKKILLMAAMLLMSVCSFAQDNNTPLVGDVNEDGKVDIADVVAILNIMKDAGGTAGDSKYYFYVGTTKPTSLSQASVVDSYPAEQSYTNNSGAKAHIFVLTNSDKNVTFINPELNAPVDQVAVDITTISGYKIFETAVGTANTKSIKIRITDVAPTANYFYVGTTKPTSLSQASVVESYPAEQTFTNPSTTEKNYIYVLTTLDKTVNFYDPSDLATPATKTEDITTIPGYKITSMTVRIAKGGTQVIKITDEAPTANYFYVGTTKPTSLSQASVVESYPAEQSYTNNSGAKSHIFVLTNSDKNVIFEDPNTHGTVSQKDVDTTTIPGYKIFETAIGWANTKDVIIKIL